MAVMVLLVQQYIQIDARVFDKIKSKIGQTSSLTFILFFQKKNKRNG